MLRAQPPELIGLPGRNGAWCGLFAARLPGKPPYWVTFCRAFPCASMALISDSGTWTGASFRFFKTSPDAVCIRGCPVTARFYRICPLWRGDHHTLDGFSTNGSLDKINSTAKWKRKYLIYPYRDLYGHLLAEVRGNWARRPFSERSWRSSSAPPWSAAAWYCSPRPAGGPGPPGLAGHCPAPAGDRGPDGPDTGGVPPADLPRNRAAPLLRDQYPAQRDERRQGFLRLEQGGRPALSDSAQACGGRSGPGRCGAGRPGHGRAGAGGRKGRAADPGSAGVLLCGLREASGLPGPP